MDEVNAITHESELVAGKSEDAEVLELALECIQCGVLVGRTSERGDIDQQHDVAAIVGPVDRTSVVHVCDLVVVDRAIAGQRVIAEHLASCLVVGLRLRSAFCQLHDQGPEKRRRHDGRQRPASVVSRRTDAHLVTSSAGTRLFNPRSIGLTILSNAIASACVLCS